ncbi:hypothetical protein R8Z50_30090 [Longispora sp. K20-0274]|uniref:hypothetical protein n=1 Tax=Longispora sp. K20-0274 TaxID=3088255 RepID=UPI00399A72A7
MAAANGQLVIERILRDREGIWRQIIEQRKLTHLTGQMLASSSIALAVYGAVLGFSNGPLQAVVSLVKLPILFLVTLAICLPTLYLFNLVFGAKLSINQAVSLVMTAITVMATLALAFTPISLFFLITAPNYSFFKLLNVAILVLSAFVGLKFLTSGSRRSTGTARPRRGWRRWCPSRRRHRPPRRSTPPWCWLRCRCRPVTFRPRSPARSRSLRSPPLP